MIENSPYEVHTAFNPAMMEASLEEDKKLVITITTNIPGDKSKIELERYFSNDDYLEIDIAKIVCRLFKEQSKNLGGVRIREDYALAFTYSVSTSDGDAFSCTAVNAVVQFGENPNLSIKQGTFCMHSTQILKYKGYPFDLACLGYLKGTHVQHIGATISTVVAPHFVVRIEDNVDGGSTILRLRDMTNTKTSQISVVPTNVPNNPFYIRWINRLGGYDHWMFSHKQIITKSISNQIIFSPSINSIQSAQGVDKVVSGDGEETILVGSEQLNSEEFETLSLLTFSPQIQWYNKNVELWITISIKSTKVVNDTSQTYRSIEYEFLLPEPQMQY